MTDAVTNNRTINVGKYSFSIIDSVLAVFFLIEFLFVVYCNLFRIPITLDNDAAKVFTHAIEMWNSKSIFIPNWVNETMLEVDTALIFAVPLFGLTKNICLSFGLSNIIILVPFYVFLYSLLKRMNQPMYIRIITYILITIPYSFGQLLYFNMMFFSGAFYGIKILLPLMLIWLITTEKADRNVSFYIVLAFTTIFSFLFSISTGPYSLICAIAPVTLCYIWLELRKMNSLGNIFSKWLISFNNIILYIQIICAMGGIVVGEIMHVDSTGSSMSVLKYHDFCDNLFWLLDSFLELFGATPYEDIQLISVAGITSLSHYAFALLFLVCMVAIIAKYLKSLIDISAADQQESPHYYLFIMFFVNLIVVILCSVFSNCRYQLMNLIPAIPLCVICVSDVVNKIAHTVQRQITVIALLLLIFVVAMTSNLRVMQDDCRPDMATNIKKYDHVIDILNNYPEKFIFMLNDEGMAETLRVYDYNSGREYLAYMLAEEKVSVHDYYSSRTDAAYFDQNSLLIVDEYITSIDELPKYISNAYAEIDGYQNIHIYKATENRMDGVVGFEANNESVDYFYSVGYEVANGDINSDDGCLHVIGNEGDTPDVISPRLICNTSNLSVEMDYSLPDDMTPGMADLGFIQVLNGDNGDIIAEATISSNPNKVKISNISTANAATIMVSIKINNGSEVCLKQLRYIK